MYNAWFLSFVKSVNIHLINPLWGLFCVLSVRNAMGECIIALYIIYVYLIYNEAYDSRFLRFAVGNCSVANWGLNGCQMEAVQPPTVNRRNV